MRERGNILFLILLAVILFAALSYAVTSSMRGGGTNASKESLSSRIAIIENHAAQIRTALMRLSTTGGYQLWQLDYSKSLVSASGSNASCTSTACVLHSPEGGGVNGFYMPQSWWQPLSECSPDNYKGRYYFRNIGIKGIGIDSKLDLTLLYFGVGNDLCLAVNEKYGIANLNGAPPEDSQNAWTDYNSLKTQEVNLDQPLSLGDEYPGLAGKQMFCARETSSGCNYLWTILLER